MATATLEQIEQDALSDLERKHYDEIRRLEAVCDGLETEFESDKANAAASKKAWEKAVCQMRACIRRGPNPQAELAFREDWRDRPIGDAIELTEKQAELLESANVTTVEDFENLRAGKHKDYPGGLSDLPRVGEATITKWEDQIVEWMTANAKPDAGNSAADQAACDDDDGEFDDHEDE